MKSTLSVLESRLERSMNALTVLHQDTWLLVSISTKRRPIPTSISIELKSTAAAAAETAALVALATRSGAARRWVAVRPDNIPLLSVPSWTEPAVLQHALCHKINSPGFNNCKSFCSQQESLSPPWTLFCS